MRGPRRASHLGEQSGMRKTYADSDSSSDDDSDSDFESPLLEDLAHLVDDGAVARGDDIGKQVYISACRDMRPQVVPISHVLSALDKESLFLSHALHSEPSVIALAACLKVNRFVKTLLLEGNNLGWKGAKHIGDALLENFTIIAIELAGNKICSNARQSLPFAAVFGAQSSIQELGLSKNCIGDQFVQELSKYMLQNPIVKKLDLSDNQIGAAGAESLAEYLGAKNVLQELNLAWNDLRNRGSVQIFDGLSRSRRFTDLSVLNLSFNGIEDGLAESLGEFLTYSSLRVLDLSRNRLGPKCAACIAAALRNNGSLMQLELGFNKLCTEKEADGTERIIGALENNHTLTVLGLENTVLGGHEQRTIDFSEGVLSRRGHAASITVEYPPRDRKNTFAKNFAKMTEVFAEPHKQEEKVSGQEWNLDKSILAPRTLEAFSRDYFDTDETIVEAFNADWKLCKEKIYDLLTGKKKDQQLRSLNAACARFYRRIVEIFKYYAGSPFGTANEHDTYRRDSVQASLLLRDAFCISLNSFTALTKDLDVRDHPNLSTTVLDKMFDDTNIEMVQQDTNQDYALERFEFLEICVRLAFAMFKTPDESVKVDDVFTKFMSEVMIPRLWVSDMDSDIFRTKFFYSKEIVALLEEHKDWLLVLFQKYALEQDSNEYDAQPQMLVKEFVDMLDDADILDEDFAQMASTRIFRQSKMIVEDELVTEDHRRASFVDFLEMLVRVANAYPMAGTSNLCEKLLRLFKALSVL